MASTYLSRTIGSGSAGRTFTISFWLKISSTSANHTIVGLSSDNNSTQYVEVALKSNHKLDIQFRNGTSGDNGTYLRRRTTRLFRDVNAWYHIVIRVDSTQTSASDRFRLYVNGELETITDTDSTPDMPQNYVTDFNNNGSTFRIGRGAGSSSYYLDGLLSHFHFADGQSLAPTVFGETDSTTGEWKIIASPTFTVGTEGFTILKDGNTITDQSSNSNDFTLSGGTLTKTEDSPSNVFCTINPLTQEHTNNSIGYSSGNTNIFFDQTGQWWHTTSTLGAITGKYYAECKIDAVGGEASLGIISSDTACSNQGTGDYMGKETDSIGYLNDGRTFKNNSAQQTGLTALSSGTIVGIAMDLDNNTVQFYINGSTSGNTVSLTADKFYLFGCSGYSDTRFYWNFGNGYFNTTAVSSAGTNASGLGIFEYDVPAGYTALCTKGLNE